MSSRRRYHGMRLHHACITVISEGDLVRTIMNQASPAGKKAPSVILSVGGDKDRPYTHLTMLREMESFLDLDGVQIAHSGIGGVWCAKEATLIRSCTRNNFFVIKI